VPEAADDGSIARGFLVAALWSAFFLLTAAALPRGEYVVLTCGLSQLIWLVPVWIAYRKKGQTESAKGVILAAAITFLLNSACWGFVKYGISG
jgi:hypothetical protein